MIGAFGIETVAQVSAVRIVDCLLEGTIIAAIAGLATYFARRQSSGTRFVLWFSALMAIAVSPVLSLLPRSVGVAQLGGVSRAAITLPGSLAVYLFALWAAVAAFLLIRVGTGLWRLRVLRKSFVPLDPAGLDPRIRETLQRDSWTKSISLCVSEHVQVPAAIGLAKPVVILPGWIVDELSATELNQLLLHELAHLRRRDDWTNLLQQLVKALFFFHPAVWWIEQRISLEREMACDDAVLAETASPRAYAECLQHMAEKTLVRRTLAMAQAALGRLRQTSMRVAQILDVHRPKGNNRAWSTGAALAGFAMVCALFGAKEPQLVAFQNDAVKTEAVRTETATSVPYPASVLRPVALKTVRGSSSSSVMPAPQPRLVVAKTSLSSIAAQRRPHPARRSLVEQGTPRVTPVRLTYSAAASAVPQEGVFVVVQDVAFSASGQPVFEIQVWRMTIVHPPVQSLNDDIPRKEI
jgi:beta-lactamase regulating signal transducer with metallopeptidase domain